MKKKQTKLWQEEDCIPSEPVFVARPGASEEDDGKQFTVIKNLVSGLGISISCLSISGLFL